ncbi:MAG: TIGR00730 family Rossman fold protein [Bacteroidales bacterium]|nr:TIGR00730 family Rossman fold protein [Bacteroidales bacterium]
MEIHFNTPMTTDTTKAIGIYGASRQHIDPKYLSAAHELGRLIGERGYALVSGGGRAGLMAAAIDGVLEVGGEAIGVLPRFMVERGWQHQGLTRMEVTETMHTRKELMARLSQGIIALPGGVGTLDELMEIITWRQLHLYHGQVVILNVDGYYDPLLAMLQRIVDQGFMRSETDNELWRVASTPLQALTLAL